MLHTKIFRDPANASVLVSPESLEIEVLAVASSAPALEEAITLAEAVLPELKRLDVEMDALQNALPTSAQRIAARDHARLSVARPDQLAFPYAPSNHLLRVELHYADGSTRINDDFSSDYRPTTREGLSTHCREKGLEEKRLLEIWDDWQERLSEAEAMALALEHRGAGDAYDANQTLWDEAHERRRDLADAILAASNDLNDGPRQIAAYLRVMDYESLRVAFDNDDRGLIEFMSRLLAPMLASEALRPAWQDVRRRYKLACEAENAAEDASFEASERAYKAVTDPIPEAWRHLSGKPLSVFTLEQIAQHRFLFDAMPEGRGTIIETAVRQYWEDIRRAEAAEQVEAFRFMARRASEHRRKLEHDVFSTSTPDMGSVLWKIALMLNLQHGLCVEEAEDVEELLGGHGDSQWLAGLYSDLTRMGGGRWPVGAEEPFDADVWIDRAVEAGADISYGRLAWPEAKLAAVDGFAFKDLSEVRKRRIREALKSRPRSSNVGNALRTYGDEGGVAWHGATELYDIVEVCRTRWDLRPIEEVMVRDGLIAAGYVDPFAISGGVQNPQ